MPTQKATVIAHQTAPRGERMAKSQSSIAAASGIRTAVSPNPVKATSEALILIIRSRLIATAGEERAPTDVSLGLRLASTVAFSCVTRSPGGPAQRTPALELGSRYPRRTQPDHFSSVRGYGPQGNGHPFRAG